MGERKVLNKYFAPDFDPYNMPRVKKPKRDPTNRMSVTMMMPMSVTCLTCGNFIYRGTKFVMRKEDIIGQNYLGIQIFRFSFRCPNCKSELSFKTDPQNHDYDMDKGMRRHYEPWKAREEEAAAMEAARKEEEEGNAMKALENRTLDSKREMDVLAALDEARALNAQKQKVDINDVIARATEAAKTEEDERARTEMEEEDRMVQELAHKQRAFVRRLDDGGEGDEGGGAYGDAEGAGAVAGPSGDGDGADDRRVAGASAAAVAFAGEASQAGAKARVRVKARVRAPAGGAQPGASHVAAAPKAGATNSGQGLGEPKRDGPAEGAGLAGLAGVYGSDSD